MERNRFRSNTFSSAILSSEDAWLPRHQPLLGEGYTVTTRRVLSPAKWQEVSPASFQKVPGSRKWNTMLSSVSSEHSVSFDFLCKCRLYCCVWHSKVTLGLSFEQFRSQKFCFETFRFGRLNSNMYRSSFFWAQRGPGLFSSIDRELTVQETVRTESSQDTVPTDSHDCLSSTGLLRRSGFSVLDIILQGGLWEIAPVSKTQTKTQCQTGLSSVSYHMRILESFGYQSMVGTSF